LVVGMPPRRPGRREGFTLRRPFYPQLCAAGLSQHPAELFGPVFQPQVAAADSLLLFRVTLVSEPMGVYQRRILLRAIRRLGGGNVLNLSKTYKISLSGRRAAWSPEAQPSGLQ
jgi:hypothetical protein